jgi:uncharacterized Zn finger protein
VAEQKNIFHFPNQDGPSGQHPSLTSKISRRVSKKIRQRGQDYWDGGRVVVLKSSNTEAQAVVIGSEEYEVDLWRESNALIALCTCPYFADHGPCKHIWAAVLALDDGESLMGRFHDVPNILLEDKEWLYDDLDDVHENEQENGARSTARRAAVDCKEPAAADEDWRARSEHVRKSIDRSAPKSTAHLKRSEWKRQLHALQQSITDVERVSTPWPEGQEVLYVIDAPATSTGQGLTVEVMSRFKKKNGQWSKAKPFKLENARISEPPDQLDRQIISQLLGAGSYPAYDFPPYGYQPSARQYYLATQSQLQTLVPLMCQTGRCRLLTSDTDETLHPVGWDDGGAWEFFLRIEGEPTTAYMLTGWLRRDEAQFPLSEPVLLVGGGLVFFKDHVAPLVDHGAFPLISLLRKQRKVDIPTDEANDFLQQLYALPRLPPLDVPEPLKVEMVSPAARFHFKIAAPDPQHSWTNRFRGLLSFEYEGVLVAETQNGSGILQVAQRRFIARDFAAERAASQKLIELGCRSHTSYLGPVVQEYEIAAGKLIAVVRQLLGDGWLVEAEGKRYRAPGQVSVTVRSGIDWFELHGAIEFDDQVVQLPEVLRVAKRGEPVVRLGDGSFGILPEDWLRRYGVIAGLGEQREDHLRFSRSQVGLLDALLASQPQAKWDTEFAHARKELDSFRTIKAAPEPRGFVGRLRPYQREGLGWLLFLQRFGLGGCLADDMGLGKTVQLLALLQLRHLAKENANKPSLVVSPRSLVFNWMQEAARFTPELRVLDHTGMQRASTPGQLQDCDVVLTTYGTLRRDILLFKDFPFYYVVLDEAQAIKNPNSKSAKAARLLHGEHRLALSGTPVENHLGELWSLIEFLNPGMLGTITAFRLANRSKTPSEAMLQLLARALRPIILRRTKDQVAKDLPSKTDQTLYCELDFEQQRLYQEVLTRYRQSLKNLLDRQGMARSKIHVLEALLRLRQIACHPGLVDPSKREASSAKLDSLLFQLQEVLDEGHKALVFSQFTSFLALVRKRLDGKFDYEYLDGQTRDRGARIERFQNDPACQLFLISLKAGGLGLNLTAADYVFLLDPWWNPAIEAQAADRAHRIGQSRPVFVYRLIARDTVEEKVLELQKTKRRLADCIIQGDQGFVRNLTKADLEMLLS